MTDHARPACASRGPNRAPFFFAAIIASAILPSGLASAQPDIYGEIDRRVVPKSAASDLASQMGGRKFRLTILALELLIEPTLLAGGLRHGN